MKSYFTHLNYIIMAIKGDDSPKKKPYDSQSRCMKYVHSAHRWLGHFSAAETVVLGDPATESWENKPWSLERKKTGIY